MSAVAVTREIKIKPPSSKRSLEHLAFYSMRLTSQKYSWAQVLQETCLFAEKRGILELSFLNIETIFSEDTKGVLEHLLCLKKNENLSHWSFHFLGKFQKDELALCKKIEACNELTTHKILFGLHYSGRESLSDALVHLARDNVSPDDLNEKLISDYLATNQSIDPQLVLFLDGKKRLGDAFIWEIAFSEFIFTKSSFGDLNESFFKRLFEEYGMREVRLGK